MARFTLLIELDNDAFRDSYDPELVDLNSVASIVMDVARCIDREELGDGVTEKTLFDANGNRCGIARFTD